MIRPFISWSKLGTYSVRGKTQKKYCTVGKRNAKTKKFSKKMPKVL